ncbi:MAG: hypothetical protein JW732_02075 [Dehalococcoidia bacterium]|nr:hypothetical protein [Dehalococcoidia bacterium]
MRIKRRTYLFSVSTDASRQDIKRGEKADDNLIFARMENPMKSYLEINRIENKETPSKEMQVPIQKEVLGDIKEVAGSVRKREIPKLVKI